MERKPIIVMNLDKLLTRPTTEWFLEQGFIPMETEGTSEPAVQIHAQQTFWDQAFLAAITGLCAAPDWLGNREGMMQDALAIADLAAEERAGR